MTGDVTLKVAEALSIIHSKDSFINQDCVHLVATTCTHQTHLDEL